MPRLKIKLHENNDTLGDRFADNTKQKLVPRIIKALDAMQDSGEINGDTRNAPTRELRSIRNQLKRMPEIQDALDWWFDEMVSNYLKEII